MNWLDRFFVSVGLQSNAGAVLPTRNAVNLVGFTVVDNEAMDRIDVTAPAAAPPSPTGTGLCTVTGGVQDAASLAMGSGIPAWITTPSSANLLAAVTDETGTGALVFGTAPLFKTSIALNNPANTFKYTIAGGAITGDRNLNLPVTNAGDILVSQAATQTLSSKTFAAPIVTGTTAWGTGTNPIIGVLPTAPVATTDATLTTIATFPAIPADTVADLIITIVGRRTGGSGTGGDCYRADFPVCYQRIGSAGPSLVGAAAVETGKKSNGGGSAYLGSVAIGSGNTIIAQGTGVASTNINWTAVIQGQQV